MDGAYFRRLSEAEQNKLLTSIITHLPQIVLLLDIDTGTNLFVNRSIFDLLGYTSLEIKSLGSKLLSEIIHPDDYKNIPKQFDEFRKLGDDEVYTHINKWKHIQGHYITIKNVVTPFKKQNGITEVVLGICSDISKEELQRQLIIDQINNVKNMAFIISHEIHHEHAKILGVFSLIEEDIELSKEDLKLIHASVKESILSLKNSIMDLNTHVTKLSKMTDELGCFHQL